jgi:hypothetical protein
MIKLLIGVYVVCGLLVSAAVKETGEKTVMRRGRMGPYETTKNTFRAEGQTGASALAEFLLNLIIWPGIFLNRVVFRFLKMVWYWLRTPYRKT